MHCGNEYNEWNIWITEKARISDISDIDIGGLLAVVRGTKDGRIAGEAKEVDGSHSFYTLILIGKLWLFAIIVASIVLYESK